MTEAALGFLDGDGDMAARMRAFDWSTTPLGPPQHWPQSLKTATSMVLNSRHAMFLAWGETLAFLYNDAYRELMGGKHPAGLGQPFKAVWGEIWNELTPLIETALSGRAIGFDDLHLVIDRSGAPEDAWFTFSYGPIVGESGRADGMYCTTAETTDKVRAQADQRAAEAALALQVDTEAARMQSLFEQAASFIAVLEGPDHVFAMANGAYRRLVGGRPLVGMRLADALPEVVDQGFVALMDTVFKSGAPHVGRGTRVALQNASEGEPENRVVDFIYQPIRSAGGEVTGVFVEGIDVTEHVRAAESLKIAQRSGGIGSFEWFPETGRIVVSEQFQRIWGLASAGDQPADNLVQMVLPDDQAVVGPRRMGQPTSANPLAYAEYRIRRADTGEIRWLARQGEVTTDAGAAPRYLGVTFDITERKRAELALIDSEAQQRGLADKLAALNATLEQRVAKAAAERDRMWRLSGDIMLVCGLDTRLTAVNPAWQTVLGWSEAELLGHSFMEFVHPADVAVTTSEAARIVGGERTYRFENRYRHRDGSYRWLSWTAVPDAESIVGVARDITADKEAAQALALAEEALRQSQKMEAVGQLTGGIAHDFNNLLQGITGSLDLVQRRAAQGRFAELDRFIAGAVASANRAASLTHRLLAFSRRQPLDPKPVQANLLVASMEDLFQRTLGEAIELDFSLAEDLWLTRSDPNQMESALLNLVINARDAMPDGGRLTVATLNVDVARGAPEHGRPLRSGQYVCLSVTDTGEGMSADVIARAFDPFFTTKPTGQGTGLGLSMIYGFAQQSEGHAEIDSEVGRGTTVRLYLPRFSGALQSEGVDADTPGDAASRPGEVVLVVEDEAVVRALIVEVLRELGYAALEAADGPDGIDVLRSARRIDLLITDIGLPGLNGRQVADAARAVRPELRVLFMTGYAENAAQAQGFLEPGMEMITKPFAMDALAARIRAMMAPA